MNLKKMLALAAAAAMTLSLASCSSGKKVASVEDLAGARIGVQLGTTGDIYIEGDIEKGIFKFII